MGDIAEMMLDGTLCEGCGVYIDEGEPNGIPRYCSKQCAKDRGVYREEDLIKDCKKILKEDLPKLKKQFPKVANTIEKVVNEFLEYIDVEI
jgi:hypothetical protein